MKNSNLTATELLKSTFASTVFPDGTTGFTFQVPQAHDTNVQAAISVPTTDSERLLALLNPETISQSGTSMVKNSNDSTVIEAIRSSITSEAGKIWFSDERRNNKKYAISTSEVGSFYSTLTGYVKEAKTYLAEVSSR